MWYVGKRDNDERRCVMKSIKKFFWAIIAALDAVVSLDKYMSILQGSLDEDRPDEHRECWQ